MSGVASALRQSDLGAALGFLGDAESMTGPDAFPPELIARLHDLVPADIIHFCELDRAHRRLIRDVFSTGEIYDDPDNDEDVEIYWRTRHQHPACVYEDRTGDFSAARVSDFTTLRALRKHEIYELRFRDWPYELGVGLPAPPWHTKVFMFHRRTTDFRQRDSDLLDLLRPHLVHLWDSARTRRIAEALAAGADAPGELVLFDAGHSIEFATARARALLREYLDDMRAARLPALIVDWLHENPRRSLTVERGPRRLVVTRVNGAAPTLLLTEEAVTRPLSRREWEVLGHVEDGLSNAEIAAVLWISPATVRTHLENIYAKLGVRSRTAAAARGRDLKRVEGA
jgi:ATP/maltotriose-dependent transcriptional regulator MalT